MTNYDIGVHVVPTAAPDDTSGLAELLNDGTIAPEDILCILGKTEGNGCVNDFSRGLATRAYRELLANRLNIKPTEVHDEILLIMSGGTEGVMTPHISVFTRAKTDAQSGTEKRLTAGTASTPEIPAEELGRTEQVATTTAAVTRAMDDAGIRHPDNVAFVQIKCPLLTADKMAAARDRGQTLAVDDTYKSMGYSRAASALGVAVATEEISADNITDKTINSNPPMYSRVASTSAGVELDHSEVLVLGNSDAATSNYTIGNAVMKDALDTEAVQNAISDAAPNADLDSVKNVFAKAQASQDGTIRGRRHVIHNDSDIESTRHARAVVNSVIGAVTGDPLAYISGGAEHQGPDGGGPVAAIVEKD